MSSISDEVEGVTGMGLRVVEHRGRPGLEQLEDDWRRLYAELPARARYHAYEAQLAYLEHLCQSPSQVRYLALVDGDQQVRAICPLEARVDTSLKVRVPVWGLPLHPHWGITDVVCPDDGIRRALVPAVLSHLRATREGRALLVLGPLPAASALWDGLDRIEAERTCVRLAEPACHFDCTRTRDELISRLSKNFARNVRRHIKNIAKLDGARYVTASEPDDLETEFEVFLAVEGSGWKGEEGARSAVRLHPDLVAYYRALCFAMRGGEDHCEINSLYTGSLCIATQFCVRTGGDYQVLKIGYDQDFSRLGPGQALMDATLRRCCDDPTIKTMDLVTYGSWQRDWHPDPVEMSQAHLAIECWPGRVLIVLLRLRYGPARRLVRWARGRSAALRSRREEKARAADQKAAPSKDVTARSKDAAARP